MATRSHVLCLVNIYLLLSVHPIQAARIKAAQNAIGGMKSTKDLVTALQKALNEHRMEDEVSTNSSTEYIGESWASCAQRKDDFERRSAKFEKLYQEANKDATVDMVESGWMILKARSLSATLSAAEKQGCDWLKIQGGVDLGNLEHVIQDAKGDVPCMAEAGASFHNKTEVSQGDMVDAFGILFSKDCKPQTFEPLGDLGKEIGLEEAEENAEETVAAKLAGKLGSPPSLLQAKRLTSATMLETQAVGMMGTVVVLFWLFILVTLMCMMIGAVFVAITGIIYCLLKTFMTLILKVLLGTFELGKTRAHFYGCGKRWLKVMKSSVSATAGVCSTGAVIALFAIHPHLVTLGMAAGR